MRNWVTAEGILDLFENSRIDIIMKSIISDAPLIRRILTNKKTHSRADGQVMQTQLRGHTSQNLSQ